MKICFATLPFYLLLTCFTSKVVGQTVAADSLQIRKIFDLSEAVRKVYAPDKRTAILQVLKDSADVNFYLIKEAQAALVPFSAFGNEDSMPWFRASVGACALQDIVDMMPRIKLALSKLK